MSRKEKRKAAEAKRYGYAQKIVRRVVKSEPDSVSGVEQIIKGEVMGMIRRTPQEKSVILQAGKEAVDHFQKMFDEYEERVKAERIQFCKDIGCSKISDSCPGNPKCDIILRAEAAAAAK